MTFTGSHERTAKLPTATTEATLKATRYLYGFEKIRKWENEERQRRFHHLVRRSVPSMLRAPCDFSQADSALAVDTSASSCMVAKNLVARPQHVSAFNDGRRNSLYGE
jgi:hypothetical protein